MIRRSHSGHYHLHRHHRRRDNNNKNLVTLRLFALMLSLVANLFVWSGITVAEVMMPMQSAIYSQLSSVYRNCVARTKLYFCLVILISLKSIGITIMVLIILFTTRSLISLIVMVLLSLFNLPLVINIY